MAETYVPIPNDGTTRKINNESRVVGVDTVLTQYVRDLRDQARTNLRWTVSRVAAAATAEGMLTLTQSVDGAATSTLSSRVVTSGKILRLTDIEFSVEAGGTVPDLCRHALRLRVNTAGAVTTASPIQGIWQLHTEEVAKKIYTREFHFPEGMEFLGDGIKEIGFSWEAMDYTVTTIVPLLSVTIHGYEY